VKAKSSHRKFWAIDQGNLQRRLGKLYGQRRSFLPLSYGRGNDKMQTEGTASKLNIMDVSNGGNRHSSEHRLVLSSSKNQ
jgi:hypothetical protein